MGVICGRQADEQAGRCFGGRVGKRAGVGVGVG